MQFKNAKVSYTLYALTGASDIFSTFRLESVAMLEKGWAYLVRADAPPLSLSPVLFADVTAETRKLEVFLAEGVILGPEGGKVPGRGATSNAGHEMELQWTDAAAALHSRVSAKRRGA
jgi:hypothetical protein